MRLDDPKDKEETDPIVFIKSKSDDLGLSPLKTMVGFSPDDLIGRTFLKEIDKEKFRGHIRRKIVEKEADDPLKDEVKFIVSYEGKISDEIRAITRFLLT